MAALCLLFVTSACNLLPGRNPGLFIPPVETPTEIVISGLPEAVTPTPLQKIELNINIEGSDPSLNPINLVAGQAHSGRVFFDHNANGLQDEGEPGLEGISLCLDAPAGEQCALSGTNGDYQLTGVPPGEHTLSISSGDNGDHSQMRYITQFVESIATNPPYVGGLRAPPQDLLVSQLQRIEVAIPLIAPLQEAMNIGLVQGYLTDPLFCSDRARVDLVQGFDHDTKTGSVRNYLGETTPQYFRGNGGGGTADDHLATDWGSGQRSLIGSPVVAAAPGVVTFAGIYNAPNGACKVVSIAHSSTGQITGYVHLDKIMVDDNQEVERGQILGTLGMTCTTWPHLHFYLRTGYHVGTGGYTSLDPYRDTQAADSTTWWTVDNEPVCLDG